METRIQYAGLMCLPGMFLVVFLGLFLSAGFLPPPSPTASADIIAAMYQQNRVGIILGMGLMVASAGLFIPFFAVVADQMRRMRGAPTSLVYAQVISGCLTVVLIVIPLMIWVTAAFRPDRDVQITQTLNDLGWLIFTMPYGPAVVQAASLGLAIVADKGGEDRVLPRWVGFLCFWLAFTLPPAGLIGFFHTGPFAWNGFIAFWLPIIVTASVYTPVLIGLLRAVARQHASLSLERAEAQGAVAVG